METLQCIRQDLRYYKLLSPAVCHKKTLFKRHGYLRYKVWFLDSGFIATNSNEKHLVVIIIIDG